MRSEEQNPGRVPTFYRDEPKGSLDFVHSGAYLSHRTVEENMFQTNDKLFTTSLMAKNISESLKKAISSLHAYKC